MKKELADQMENEGKVQKKKPGMHRLHFRFFRYIYCKSCHKNHTNSRADAPSSVVPVRLPSRNLLRFLFEESMKEMLLC